MQSCDINLKEEVSRWIQASPYIVVVGDVGKKNTRYFISCETVLVESKML